jgi:hypothetical protein
MPKKIKVPTPVPVTEVVLFDKAAVEKVESAIPPMVQLQDRFSLLLPTATQDLTVEEQKKVQVYQEAKLVLGSAGVAPMRCAGEQCPIANTCPLMKIKKAPLGETCPFEANYVVTRFVGWMGELNQNEQTLSETDRSSIAQLVVIDLQEQRCLSIMSEGKSASMTDLSVKEVDLQTGDALSYEKIVHANMQILQELRTARRMILDDMERTAKAKTRRLKIMQGHTGKDLATRQSANADKIRNAIDTPDYIEIKK